MNAEKLYDAIRSCFPDALGMGVSTRVECVAKLREAFGEKPETDMPLFWSEMQKAGRGAVQKCECKACRQAPPEPPLKAEMWKDLYDVARKDSAEMRTAWVEACGRASKAEVERDAARAEAKEAKEYSADNDAAWLRRFNAMSDACEQWKAAFKALAPPVVKPENQADGQETEGNS